MQDASTVGSRPSRACRSPRPPSPGWLWGRKFYCNYRSHLPLWEIEMWKLALVERENTNLNEHILCQETLNRIQMASPARLAAPVKMKKKFSQFTIKIELPPVGWPSWCVHFNFKLFQVIVNCNKLYKLKVKIYSKLRSEKMRYELYLHQKLPILRPFYPRILLFTKWRQSRKLLQFNLNFHLLELCKLWAFSKLSD